MLKTIVNGSINSQLPELAKTYLELAEGCRRNASKNTLNKQLKADYIAAALGYVCLAAKEAAESIVKQGGSYKEALVAANKLLFRVAEGKTR